MAKPDSENSEKKSVARSLREIQGELERLVVKLSGTDALNEASYLRKAIAEIKRAQRTL